MTPARRRLVALLGIAVAAGALFLAWSQTWFTLQVQGQTIVVRGDVAAGALPPLALVSLALILALALAGPAFRIVLGVLEVLIGVTALVVSAFALGNPGAASAPAITKATGIAGSHVPGLVSSSAATVWPIVGIAGGALAALVAVFVIATATSWPVTGRRFSRTRTAPDGAAATRDDDPVREWDALTEGDDPTLPSP